MNASQAVQNLDVLIPMVLLFTTVATILCFIVALKNSHSAAEARARIAERPESVRSFKLRTYSEGSPDLLVTFKGGKSIVIAHGDDAVKLADKFARQGLSAG